MSVFPDRPTRVAAYCRVSTDKEDQRNSLEAQRRFFLSYIQEHPAWTLVGIFADEGLSGTSIRRRAQFSELLRRAMAGQVDLILTKEVSRFARNTVDTLQVTRRLKDQGVGVIFLNDNIDTRDNDGEFRLTIMASVAQEESRKISERTRWGQLQAMKRGVVFGNNSIYGYTLQSGRLSILPDQARIVQQVYAKFLDEKKGAHTIARELTQSRVPPPLRSSGPWSSAMVLRILRNEKYCGDLLQKKFRTTDYLTHHKIPNDGAEESIYLQDHHPAIVSRSQFQQVQAELARRSSQSKAGTRFSARYWYSGKIRCAACGRSFSVKRTRRPDGSEYTRFVCRGRTDGSGQCSMRSVPGDLLLACAQSVLSQLPIDGPAIAREVMLDLQACRTAPREERRRQLEQAVLRQEARRGRALEAFLDGALPEEDLAQVIARCSGELDRLRRELARPEEPSALSQVPLDAIQRRLEQELSGGEAVLDEVIQRITVYPDCLLVEAGEPPLPFLVRAKKQDGGGRSSIAVTECRPIVTSPQSR